MTRAEKRRRRALVLAATQVEPRSPVVFALAAAAVGAVVYLIAGLCYTLAQVVIFAMERL